MAARALAILDHRGQPIRAQAPYDSAGTGRRAKSWHAPGTGPNATLAGSLPTMRNRSRAGYRNNPWIRRGVNSLTTNEIGTGIIPRSRVDDEEFRSAQNDLWDRFAQEIDADWSVDAYGIQTLSSRTRNQAGEVFLRRRIRPDSWGLAVPMQVQVLEPEFVPINLHRTLSNGNRVRHGIEIDRRGRRVAYWMYTSHPGERDGHLDMGKMVRVLAKDVIHHYVPLRPGQLRGEPVTAQALLKAHTLDSYDDAELVRKQTRAPYTGMIKRPDMTPEDEDWKFDPMTGDPIKTDAEGVPTMSAEPGTWLVGMPGEEPILFNGDDTGRGYADFMRQQLLGLATGLDGIPYEILSGDWSQVNDRLVRAVLQEFRRGVEATQDLYMIHQVCRRIWHWFTDIAVLRGRLEANDYARRRPEFLRHAWQPQGWPYLHPEQDINAKVQAIDHDLSSLDKEVARTGYDAAEIQRENVEAERRRMDLRQEFNLPSQEPA